MLVLFFVVWIFCAIACATIASNKGHSGCLWGLLGLVFGFFALLLIAVIPAVRQEPVHVSVHQGDRQQWSPEPPAALPSRPTKACPDCAELILADAKVCKHCGYRFDGQGPVKALEPPVPDYDDDADRALATVLVALAEAACPLTWSQNDAIAGYIVRRRGQEVTKATVVTLRHWVSGLASDMANLKPALAVAARLDDDEAGLFLDAIERVTAATIDGDIMRQRRFRMQLEAVIGSAR